MSVCCSSAIVLTFALLFYFVRKGKEIEVWMSETKNPPL